MLSLLGSFELRSGGEPVEVPHAAQRLLAFLALQERPVSRSFVAGTLWPDTTDQRAGASLRSTLWRISQLCEAVATWPNQRLALSAEVVVDLDQATGKARLLLDPGSPSPDHMLTPDLLDEDLLPEWDEDWLRKGQEVFRERRLRALEAMTGRLSDAGRHWQAVEAGLEAAVAEPLRESAQRALVKAYLADGNWGEALRQYRSFRDHLVAELGVEPTPEFLQLITPLRSATGLAIVGQQAR